MRPNRRHTLDRSGPSRTALHPLIILTAVAAGAALANIAGVFVVVPLTAVIINVGDELINPGRPRSTDRGGADSAS